MLDVFNIPTQQDSVKVFYANGTIWQTWQKPRNAKFVWIMCIGGGAGGAGAGISISAAAGGSGGVCKVLYPANVLPDVLYVQPGLGSLGAAGSTTATNNNPTAANRSFVSISPATIPNVNVVCVSGAAGAGTTLSNNAETVATTTQAGLLSLGNFTAVAGQAGDNSLVGIVPLTTTITCGGAAGGNASAGANVSSVNLGPYSTPQILGGSTGGTIGGDGSNGVWYWKPMFGLGGAGGGDGSITGGKGGDGAYGCGGGGGGKGGTTGGAGGKGGDGLVIIATF